jgi:cob(I)alamin adenosyltransferase
VDTEEVVGVLKDRPGFQHVIVTGRDAPEELVEAADLVSEVRKVKHPMDEGYRGQKGIEW